KTSKDSEPTTDPKKKDSTSGSSKGTQSKTRSSGKSVQSEEPVSEVADSNMPHDQEGNLGVMKMNQGKRLPLETTKEGPTQTWLMNLAASNPTEKTLKDFDELMSTPIEFSLFFLNGLKIKNLTQEILLGPAFRLLKGTRSNYAELEYDFEECYKALSEKLDWENPEGGDYPFDLSKPLPLITHGKRQRVPFEFFINNDLKYLQGGILTMTNTTSTTKTKAAKYDLPGIEDMVPNIWSLVKVAYDKYALWGISHWREQCKSFYAFARGMQSRGDVYSTKHILEVTYVSVMRKHGYGYLEEIVNRLINLSWDDVADFTIALRMFTKSLVIQKRVDALRELYKFSDGTLTRLLSSLEDITKNIDMEYLPKRRWSNLEKKRAHFMIKVINKLLKERRMMRSLDKFVVKMEILLELTSNKHNGSDLGVILYDSNNVTTGKTRWDGDSIRIKLVPEHAEYDESNTYVLERFNTTAGNPVKKILLKLNLSDHRSILTDSKEYLKMVMERQSVKVKEIQERCIIKAFQDYQIKKGMSMSVQKLQVHEMEKFTRWRNKIILG
ncbi:hypothetical protein Tco_0191484, partial [Tanacetum coccineum]